MKIQNFVMTALLLVVTAVTLPAQNTLPTANDNSCWSSLSALRACQLQTEERAQAYAERCSSYPEYQCNDYYQAPAQTSPSKMAAKADHSKPETKATAYGNSQPTPNNNIVETSSAAR